MRLDRVLFGLRLWPCWAALALSAVLAPSARAELNASNQPTAPPTERTRLVSFAPPNGQATLRLRPSQPAPPWFFGLRADEQVTQATLRLSHSFSPGLTPGRAQIRVLLNGQVVATLPMPRAPALDGQGRPGGVTREIPLAPSALGRYNQLRLELLGQEAATDTCPAPSATAQADATWVDIASDSRLSLTVRPQAVEKDLALLPEPFFDPADTMPPRLPFVFAATPTDAALRAAGMAASWLGVLADWRKPRFPVHLDTLPPGHALVFATNTESPAFLAAPGLAQPPFTGPELRLLDHPRDPTARLLLIGGRDGAELVRAAQALVLGTAGLSGAQARVLTASPAPPRLPYDAPNWVRLDRPMRFGELITSAGQLQVSGQAPPPVSISLRIPPDLFTWRSPGVPVDLKLRYTPPNAQATAAGGQARVTMRINGEAVQTMALSPSGRGGAAARVVLPLLDTGLLSDSREVLIPAFKLGSRNQLDYVFEFGAPTDPACGETRPDSLRAMIDADSRIDFSGHPHYAEMPHLGYFATSGFPYTIHADLAQTVALLPQAPAAPEIEVLLALLARMGASTGYPATRLQIARGEIQGEPAALQGRDLLMVGAPDRLPLLHTWRDAWQATLDDHGTTEAALLGFESPLTPGRSVVAVTAFKPEHYTQVLDLLDQDAAIYTLHGGAVLLPGKQGAAAHSVPARHGYTTGQLPFWTAIWYPLSGHPVLLALMAVLAVLVLAFALWRSLKATAERRLGEPGG